MDRNEFVQPSVTTRIFEKSLLTKSDFERLIETADIEDAIRALQETTYKEEISKLSAAQNYEEALDNMLLDFYKKMYEMTREDLVVDLLALKYYYHNLKVVLKEYILGEDLEYLYYKLENFPRDEIKKSIDTGASVEYSDVVREAMEEYEKGKNPQDIDIFIDKKYFEHLKKIAKESKVELFDKYVRNLIDFTNIATVLRCKRQDRTIDFLKKVLVEGGSIEVGELENIFGLEVDENSSVFRRTEFYKYLKKGIEEYKQTGTMSEFERQKDNYFMELVKDVKKVTYGPEVLFAYLYARETEIKNIRMILISKLNSTDTNSIRERLRETYV
ncbi:V-type ATP synthase subunit C [Peptoniphilus indolicus]|nr:V-type ATP synthase subunit C [Peptoniphilus indolicus]SUB74898.1 V-type sodium pump subunit C [Peptoniphilus indolicus]